MKLKQSPSVWRRQSPSQMERWVVTNEAGGVISAYMVGPGAEVAARAQAEAVGKGAVVWRIVEEWTRESTVILL